MSTRGRWTTWTEREPDLAERAAEIDPPLVVDPAPVHTHRTTVAMLDGYEFAATLAQDPESEAISGWGRDGWDAGEWPYCVLGWSRGWHEGCRLPTLIEYVEGDVTVRYYDTDEQRLAATDRAVEWHWRHGPNSTGPDLSGYAEGRLPEQFRGPFSWARLENGPRQEIA